MQLCPPTFLTLPDALVVPAQSQTRHPEVRALARLEPRRPGLWPIHPSRLAEAGERLRMTGYKPNTSLRSRGTICPRFASISRPLQKQRAQGMPDARCTRDLMRNVHKECAHEHTGQRRTYDITCAMALRLI